VAVECFHHASLLNCGSEHCDLVTCDVHSRILFCTVHAFSSDTMPPGLDQWSWRCRGKDHTVGLKNLRKTVMKIITRRQRGTRKKDKLARNLDHLSCPKPPDDNLNLPRTPSPTMHSSCHSAHFPKAWGARHSAVCTNGQSRSSLLCWFGFGCYFMTHFLTIHMCFCLRECTVTQGYQHKKSCTVQRHANAMRNSNARGDGNTR